MYGDLNTTIEREVLTGPGNKQVEFTVLFHNTDTSDFIYRDPKYDLFINKDKIQKYNEAKKLLEDGAFVEKYGFLGNVLNNSKNTELLYSILWHAGSDSCEDLLQYCEFAGEEKNCADLFMILPTSSGPCCTFNTNPEMYKDSPFNKVKMI